MVHAGSLARALRRFFDDNSKIVHEWLIHEGLLQFTSRKLRISKNCTI